jgi:6-phosphogluconolactonase/glucosamine-6-phosphate isomerase/deaminase
LTVLFFSIITIKQGGEVAENEIEKHCEEYEQLISKFGGIDLQILGIGRTGHIGMIIITLISLLWL